MVKVGGKYTCTPGEIFLLVHAAKHCSKCFSAFERVSIFHTYCTVYSKYHTQFHCIYSTTTNGHAVVDKHPILLIGQGHIFALSTESVLEVGPTGQYHLHASTLAPLSSAS